MQTTWHNGSQMRRRPSARFRAQVPKVERDRASGAARQRALDLVSEMLERMDSGDTDWSSIREMLLEVERELGDI